MASFATYVVAAMLILLVSPARALYRLLVNYLAARKLGLPMIVMPVSPPNPLYFFLSAPLHWLLVRLPLVPDLARRMTDLNYSPKEKARIFMDYGPALVVVSPRGLLLDVADKAVVERIYATERKGDFDRPWEFTAMLEVFGRNISTARHATDWQRNRRATAASFNEATNAVVWLEALKQSGQMLSHWLSVTKQHGSVTSSANDLRILAMNVMLRAGFGKEHDFTAGDDLGSGIAFDDGRASPPGPKDALQMILNNAVLVLGVGPYLAKRLAPFSKTLGRLSKAMSIFKDYMATMLAEEQRRKEAEGPTTTAPASRPTLLGSLVRSSVNDKLLSHEEVFGNMFVYNFAGYDTTANSFMSELTLLAANPEVQDWIAEEIRCVFADDDPATWTYDKFPRLKRTLAVLLETARLYNPFPGIPRITTDHPVNLDFSWGSKGPRSVTVPANTILIMNVHAMHTLPQYWGDDSLTWRPSRWIKTTTKTNGASLQDMLGAEELLVPESGTFLGWSSGQRACPGKKFAHVEHVALMATLFRDRRVVPIKLGQNETDEQARRRLVGYVDQSELMLTVQMMQPERAVVLWQ